MSTAKIGDTVRVKATGAVGVVYRRLIFARGDVMVRFGEIGLPYCYGEIERVTSE